MGKLKILTALLLAAALTACGDDSDVFYSAVYSVARVEVSVSLTDPEEPENPDPENPDPENPAPENPAPENPGTETSETEEPENPEEPERRTAYRPSRGRRRTRYGNIHKRA